MAQTSAMPDLRQPKHQIRPFARAINRKTSAIRQFWACVCQHHHAILILTRHDDLKEAIRAWNKEATRQGRKHSK